jgi:hypothetical protein
MALAFILVVVMPTQQAHAGIFGIIKAIVVKAIKVADLKIQKLQNKTLDLQNAQKKMENQMAKQKLNEITNWTSKQKAQYQKYFDELKKVKSVIRDYQRVKDILQMQWQITTEYSRVWQQIEKDKNFSAKELEYMGQVYSGILKRTLENVKQIRMITTSYSTEMSDAKRMEIADNVAEDVQSNYDNLRRFNHDNIALSLSRTKSKQENQQVKNLYGIR